MMKSVSCVTVTRGRYQRWLRSFEGFLHQDYPNRELVVLVDRDEEGYAQIREHLRAHGIANARTKLCRENLPLGELRNRAIELAEGEVVCQWDDDDLYHPLRLSWQLQQMENQQAQASYLQEHLGLVESSGDLYWCDWIRTLELGMSSTMMVYKSCMPKYLPIRTHEDSLLQRALQKSCRVVSLCGFAGLHVYVDHGSNTSAQGHHLAVFRHYGLECATLRERRTKLCHWLQDYPALSELHVRGHRGDVAFTYSRPDASSA